VAEDLLVAHIDYLEGEVKRIGERADKLEAIIRDLETDPKSHGLREIVKGLRNEATEHRKYISLVKT
jgi:hypothetical protein